MVPAHIGIKDNEKADKKHWEESKSINTAMGKGEIKAKIKCEIMQIWLKEGSLRLKPNINHINQAEVGGKG